MPHPVRLPALLTSVEPNLIFYLKEQCANIQDGKRVSIAINKKKSLSETMRYATPKVATG